VDESDINSVGNALMINPKLKQGTPTMFYCGNDADAQAQVAGVIRQFGWERYDCGGIIAARAIEPLCILWCLPGFLRNEVESRVQASGAIEPYFHFTR
jgi:predicted dinucleotide-binding enzyme